MEAEVRRRICVEGGSVAAMKRIVPKVMAELMDDPERVWQRAKRGLPEQQRMCDIFLSDETGGAVPHCRRRATEQVVESSTGDVLG